MRVGQVGDVAERVQLLRLFSREWAHTASVQRRALAAAGGQREQQADRLVTFSSRLWSAFAGEEFGHRAFGGGNLVFLESFGPTQRRFTCLGRNPDRQAVGGRSRFH